MKDWSRGGREGGRERAGVEKELVCRLKYSFEILSEKYVANSCGSSQRDNVGRERFAVLCRFF